MEGSPNPETINDIARGVRVGNVVSPVNLGRWSYKSEKRMMMEKLNRLAH
jgi:hypothetical protein